MISVKRTVEPTVEPVTLQQAKDQCRVIDDADTDVLVLYIKAAREYAERQLGRAIMLQTLRMSRSSFQPRRVFGHALGIFGLSGQVWDSCLVGNHPILLPRPNLIEVLEVTYVDPYGDRQTLDPGQYVVTGDAEFGAISPAPGCWWPATARNRPDAVQVTYTAGYGATPDAVPASVQLAILGLTAHWFENRESVVLTSSPNASTTVPMFVDSLLLSEASDIVFDYEA